MLKKNLRPLMWHENGNFEMKVASNPGKRWEMAPGNGSSLLVERRSRKEASIGKEVARSKNMSLTMGRPEGDRAREEVKRKA